MGTSTLRPGTRPPLLPRATSGQRGPRRVESQPMTPRAQLLTLIEKDLFFRLLLVFLAYSLVPLGEIFFFLYLASLVGNYLVMIAAALVGVVGAFLGLSQARRIAARLKAARSSDHPGVEMAGLVVAGILLITPGFLTDVAGYLLLVPPLRAWAGRHAVALLRDHAPRLYARLGFSTF